MPFSCFLFRPRKRLEKRRKRSHTNASNASVTRTSTPSAQTATFAFTSESGYTHSAFGEKSHTAARTPKQGVFRTGVVSLPSDCFTRFGNPAWPGGRTAYFAAFGSWSGVLSKNTESLRSSDALMRVAAPRRRGPAGLRDLFRFCQNCGFHALRSELSVRAKQGWYHYPRCALHVLETPDGRLPKGLICRFQRLPSSTPCAVTFSANTQISLSAISVANTFALWYDKSQIRTFRR